MIHRLVVALHGSLQARLRKVLVKAHGHLRSGLRLDVRIAQLPSIRRRHDRGVRQLMDVLPHRVIARLHGETIHELIPCGDAELRPLIGLVDPASLLVRLDHARGRGQLIRLIQGIGARPHHVEQAVAYPRLHREGGGDIPTVAHVERRFQCFLPLHPVIEHQRPVTFAQVFAGVQVVIKRAKPEIQQMLVVRLPVKVGLPVKLVDAERQLVSRSRIVGILRMVAIMVVAGGEGSRQVRMEGMRPSQGAARVLVGVSLRLVEAEAVVAEIAGQRQAVVRVEPMIDRGVQVVETRLPVLIPALLGQKSQEPVGIGGTRPDDIRGILPRQRPFQGQAARQQADTGRALEFLLAPRL